MLAQYGRQIACRNTLYGVCAGVPLALASCFALPGPSLDPSRSSRGGGRTGWGSRQGATIEVVAVAELRTGIQGYRSASAREPRRLPHAG